jgi:hypothetical protein
MIMTGLDNFGLQYEAINSSHGEGLRIQVSDRIGAAGMDGLPLFLDECDGNLDIETVSTLVCLENLYRNAGSQSVVISHHPLFLLTALRSMSTDFPWGLFESRIGAIAHAVDLMGWDPELLGDGSGIQAIFLPEPVELGDSNG